MTNSHPQTCVGHVNLKVSDLERSIAFYRNVMGLELMQRFGSGGAFLGFGGYHHHIALNTLSSKGGPPAPDECTGLHHVALLYPNKESLVAAVRRVNEYLEHVGREDAPVVRDHGVSQAVYFRDPDNILIELYCDRPQADWPVDQDGNLAMINEPLELEQFLS